MGEMSASGSSTRRTQLYRASAGLIRRCQPGCLQAIVNNDYSSGDAIQTGFSDTHKEMNLFYKSNNWMLR